MGETDELVQGKYPCPALHRMHRAEYGIHRFRLGGTVLHGDQTRFEFRQLFLAFLEKCFPDCRHRVVHVQAPLQAETRRIASISFTGSNGFTIQPVAPAARARFFLSTSTSV